MVVEKLSKRLESMTFREKIDYLWDYYKFHLLGTILAVAFIIYLVTSITGNKDSVLSVVFLGQAIDTVEMQELDDQLDQQLIPEETRNDEEVLMQFIDYSSDPESSQSMVGVQKFTAQLSANAIDVIISDSGSFEMLRDQSEGGALLALENVIDINEINTDEHELYYSDTDKVIGISTAEMDPLQNILPDGEQILYVPANYGNDEYIDDLIQFLTAD